MRIGVEHPGTPVEQRRPITVLPTTLLGRWAVALTATFLLLVLVGTVVPRGGGLALACGLAAGIAALLAIVRARERALTVFAALGPFAFAVAFVVAELISGIP